MMLLKQAIGFKHFTGMRPCSPAAYEDFGRAVDTLPRLGRFDEAVLL